MSKLKMRLGRGLDALISQGTRNEEGEGKAAGNAIAANSHNALGVCRWVTLSHIVPNPRQPRKSISPESVHELAASIQAQGLLQPIVVREAKKGSYELIAGERRLIACKRLGYKEIPAMVCKADDAQAATWALIENLQRENLNPIDEALAFASLIQDFDLTQETVAQRVGKARVTVTNALRLLQLAPGIQELLRHNQLTAGHAKILLGISDEEVRSRLAREVVEKSLSVRALEQRVQLLNNLLVANQAKSLPRDPLERRLTDFLGTTVRLKQKRKEGCMAQGRMIIHYKNREELEKILQRLGVSEEETVFQKVSA